MKLAALNFSDNLINEYKNNNAMLTITILLEYTCNFRCEFCYSYNVNKTNNLTTEQLKETIFIAKELGIKTVLIAGAGEPMMAKNFDEIVDYVMSLNLSLVVFSNLSLITKKRAQEFYRKNINIIGKLNSFKKETQELLIGNVNDAFEQMKKGLNNLIKYGFNKENENNETMFAIETPILPENVCEIFDIWKFCRKNNIQPIVDTILYEGKAKNYDYDKFFVDYPIIRAEVEKINEYDRGLGVFWAIKMVQRYNGKGVIVGELNNECYRIGTNLNVDEDGNVFDCFAMSETYGNIKDIPLKEIWLTSKPKAKFDCNSGLCQCRNLNDRKTLTQEMLENNLSPDFPDEVVQKK